MANSVDKIAKSFSRAFRDASKKKTVGYDTPAIVTRIDGKTAWVHIPGGVDETPVSLTLSAKAGDEVQIRVSGGRAWLTGNTTAPPTDDGTAVIAQKKAESVGAHVDALATTVAIIDSAYITTARVNTLLADYATITELHSDYISANTIEATYATLNELHSDYITASTISSTYATITDLHTNYAQITLANIDTANINTAKIKDLFVQVGLIKDAVISGAKITGYLDAVEVNAANITAGTLIADRIAIRGSNTSLVYALNNYGQITSTQTNTIDGYILTERTINANKIVANSITGGEIAANTITAFNIIGSSLSAIYADLGTITAGVLKSSNYSYSSGNYSTAGMIIDLNNKLIRTPKFAVDASGKLYATGADVSGTITATGGSIAGWAIGGSALTKGTLGANDSIQLGTADLGSATIAGKSLSTWRLAVGSGFGVDKNGVLYASGATISGTITTNDKLSFTRSGLSGNGEIQYNTIAYFYIPYVLTVDATIGRCRVEPSGQTTINLPALNVSGTVFYASEIRGTHIYIDGTIDGSSDVRSRRLYTQKIWVNQNVVLESIRTSNGTTETEMIRFLPVTDAYGHGISIGGGGATIIGGGESATACQSLLPTYGDERMIIANDGDIEFYSNCQNGISSAYMMTFNSAGYLYVGSTTDTIERDVFVQNNVASLSVCAGTANHGLWSSTKGSWIIRVSNGSSDNNAYIPHPLLTDGSIYATISSGMAVVQARNSGSGNRIYMWSQSSDGTCGIASYGANNTYYGILTRSNNSHAITTYGNWYFSANAVFNGNLYSRISTSNAWIQAENVNGGNAIAIEAHTDGTVVLWSRGANGTSYYILSRANNSHTITTYGDWTFDGTLRCKNYAGNAGRPVTSASTDGKQVSAFECVNSTTLHVSGQWGTTGSSFAWRNAAVTSSDIRLKENIADCTVTALPLINNIRMRAFDWKEDGRHQKIGFIADELEKLDAKLAIGGGYDADGSMDIKSVDTFYLLGYAIKAIQELSQEINRLKGESHEES